jgi:hypothetical protein
MAHSHPANAADQRTPVSEAFNQENKYWGARFCRTELVTPWKLLWTTAKVRQFTTTLRIFPAKNPDHHADWDPYRTGPGKDDFGDWMRWHWAWRRGGYKDPITFLLHPQRIRDEQNPAVLLRKTVQFAVENNRGAKGHWGAMISDKGRGAVIPKPKRMSMVQGAIFEHAGLWFDIPRGLGEDDNPVLVDLGSDAAKGIAKLSRERWKPEELEDLYNGQPEHWLDHFKYGDPVSLDAGRFFEIYPEAAPPAHVLRAGRSDRPQAPTGPLRLSPAAMRQRAYRDDDDEEEGRAIQGYTVTCHDQAGPDEYTQYSPILSDYADLLYEKVRPWSQVLIFPTYQEQAQLIAPLLRLPDDSNPNGALFLDVLEKAWGDHRDWMPDVDGDLWAEWVGRVHAPGSDIPGAGAQPTGPALQRRPPQARVDETVTARDGGPVRAAAPFTPSTPAPAPAPVAQSDNGDAPPPRTRLRPGQHTSTAEPAPVTVRPTEGVSAADYFRQQEAEEQALKDKGIRPDFPTPGQGDAAPTVDPARSDAWRDRLAARNLRVGEPTAAAVAAPAPAAAVASSPPPQSPPEQLPPPAPVEDAGGGFTPPPVGKGAVSITEQLARMRAAAQKIPKS